MNTLLVIPARMGSSRFPGKPMALIAGKPMIGHVYERVCKSNLVTTTAVATCDKIIFDYIESIGGIAVMTSNTHERASDRCAEALIKLEQFNKIKYDIVVMVQGDEPMIQQDMIKEAVSPMILDNSIQVVNLMAPITEIEEFEDRNCIKVVCDLQNNALFFSREPIPTRSKTQNIPMYKQVCVIPFKRDFLIEYNKLIPTPLEVAESVDMMRILENGINVKMVLTYFNTHAVDIPADLDKVEILMQKG